MKGQDKENELCKVPISFETMCEIISRNFFGFHIKNESFSYCSVRLFLSQKRFIEDFFQNYVGGKNKKKSGCILIGGLSVCKPVLSRKDSQKTKSVSPSVTDMLL